MIVVFLFLFSVCRCNIFSSIVFAFHSLLAASSSRSFLLFCFILSHLSLFSSMKLITHFIISQCANFLFFFSNLAALLASSFLAFSNSTLYFSTSLSIFFNFSSHTAFFPVSFIGKSIFFPLFCLHFLQILCLASFRSSSLSFSTWASTIFLLLLGISFRVSVIFSWISFTLIFSNVSFFLTFALSNLSLLSRSFSLSNSLLSLETCQVSPSSFNVSLQRFRSS